jgi:hypothetical protein
MFFNVLRLIWQHERRDETVVYGWNVKQNILRCGIKCIKYDRKEEKHFSGKNLEGLISFPSLEVDTLARASNAATLWID